MIDTKNTTLTWQELSEAKGQQCQVNMPNRQGSHCPACGANWRYVTYEADQEDWNSEDRYCTCRKCHCRWYEQWVLDPIITIDTYGAST